MSVYTQVDQEALAEWLAPCGVGALLGYKGIAAGVENSNYFVSTESGEYVLTLFERLSENQLGYYLGLMAHLAARGYPCPQPLPGKDGVLWRPLAGKPAALVTRLPGSNQEKPSLAQCAAIGRALGQLHRLAADYPLALPNPRGASWRVQAAQALLPLLAASEQQQLQREIAFQSQQDYSLLPQGVIHADLFRDNVLWNGETLSGVLDFYFAGNDALLFDLAVTVNEWAEDDASASALIAAYESERMLTDVERQAWKAMRRAAALRFWLSRLDDMHHPRPGAVVTVKDPAYFGSMLARLAAH